MAFQGQYDISRAYLNLRKASLVELRVYERHSVNCKKGGGKKLKDAVKHIYLFINYHFRNKQS